MSNEGSWNTKYDLFDFILTREFNFIKTGFSLAYREIRFQTDACEFADNPAVDFSSIPKLRQFLDDEWLVDFPDCHDGATRIASSQAVLLRYRQLEKTDDDKLVEIANLLESHDLYDLTSRGSDYDLYQFYSLAAASLNIEHWSKMNLWTAEEAVAISLSKDPSKVNEEALPTGPGSNHSPFIKDFRSRLDMTKRAIKARQLTDPIDPVDFLIWSRDRFESPAELIELVQQHSKQQLDLGEGPKGISNLTLYKLAVGMAILNYGLPVDYSTNKGSKAPKNIHDALQTIGLKTDVKTVRDALSTAITYLAEKGLAPKPPKAPKATGKTSER